MTLRVGLIGDPVGHSISPRFQQAAFDAAGVTACYEAWLTPAADLAQRVASLRAPDALGANVTVPHKQAVMALLDQLDPAAAATGAVNTLVQRGGRLTGYNTDVVGFVEAVKHEGGLDLAGTRVVVLGAGGSARAVVHGLIEAGAAAITVLARRPAAAEALAQAFGGRRVVGGLLPASPAEVETALAGCDVLVNCTPVGMWHGAAEDGLPLPAEALRSSLAVVDIVANPLVTPLLAAATAAGCRTLGGLPMLVRQGAASFTLWTGQPAPLDVMFAAARRAMGLD